MAIKSHYDSSCATWNPKGKLFQVEYAQQAVNLGSICLGLRNDKYAVLCTLKRAQSELAGFQEKTFKIDDNIGMSIAGLTADARVLCKYMRNECLNHRYVYESEHPLNRLVQKVAEKSQAKTQVYHKRPYGVGLLLAGYDKDGPHIIQTDPSANYYEYYAYSIGGRCQGARTYFEDNLEQIKNTDLDGLILHGVKALKKATADDEELTGKNIEISIVGENTPFYALPEQRLQELINQSNENQGNQMEEEN